MLPETDENGGQHAIPKANGLPRNVQEELEDRVSCQTAGNMKP